MWLSLPSQAPYEAERRAWLRQAHEAACKQYSELKISSHALLLLIDIERSFCAGAWLSVVVLSQACVEGSIRQVVEEDYSSPASKVFGTDAELTWLRELRNEIIHASKPGTPSKLWKEPPNDLTVCHAALEPEAKRAVKLAYRSAYAGAVA
jgi:hypothetical protein